MSIFSKKEPEEQKSQSLIKEGLIFFGEIIKVIIISLVIIIPIRYFLIQPFYVKGASMEPTFQNKEYLIIDELSKRFSEFERGQVVVFRYPLRPSDFFIKRIIGLPGEKIEIKNNTIIILNNSNPEGFVLLEPYLNKNESFGEHSLVEIGNDEYFVLGDNRDESLDSRTFGPINKKFITGKVLFRGWPFDRIGFYKTPEYSL